MSRYQVRISFNYNMKFTSPLNPFYRDELIIWCGKNIGARVKENMTYDQLWDVDVGYIDDIHVTIFSFRYESDLVRFKLTCL